MISAGSDATAAGGVLDHVAHDRLEAVGDAVELVLQRRGDAHVAADQVAVPADADADALHVAGTTHRHGPAAADAVEHVVADHAAADVHAIGIDAGLRPGDADDQRDGRHEQRGPQGRLRAAQEVREGGVHRGFLT
jgi:hypothetical protein